MDISRGWKVIRENAKVILGHYELKRHKPWFDEEYSKLSKQAKLQWLQIPSEMNRDI